MFFLELISESRQNDFGRRNNVQDSELLELIKAKSNKGMNILMDRYMGLVSAVINGKIGSICTREDVEEAAADTFVDFYRQVGHVDLGKGSLRSYLCAIAKNKAISIYKSKCRGVRTTDFDEAENIIFDGLSADDEVINAEIRKKLFEEISKLDKTDREIVFRKYYIGEPSKVIAERMKMTVSAVDTRTHRIIQKLKERMEDFI